MVIELRKGSVILFVGLTFAVPFFSMVYAFSQSSSSLRKILIVVEPYFLLASFLLLSVLPIIRYKIFLEEFSKIDRGTWLLLLVVVCIGFFFRQFVVPHTHRVFFDEDLYLGVGNSIATEFKNILCNYGTPTHCIDGILNKDPSGFPFLVAILFKIFGPSQQIAYDLSVFIGTLSIVILFLFVYTMLRSKSISLLSAFLLSITPVHIVWSGSTATEIYFMFFSLLSLLLLSIYVRKKDLFILIASVASLAYAVQTRPEGFIFVVIFALFILVSEKFSKIVRNGKVWFSVLVFSLLISAHMVHLIAVRNEDWGAPNGKKFGMAYFKSNFADNILFWLNGQKHPLVLSIFSIFGIVYLIFSRKRKFLLLILSWWVLYFLLFTSFYAGGVNSGGIGSRYVVIYLIPSLILGAYGLYSFGKKNIIRIVFIALILISLIPTWNFITVPDRQAQYARDMHKFVMDHMNEINSSCWVLTHNPSIFLVNGKNSLQTRFGGDSAVMNKIFSQSSCVLWLEGAWCLFEPHKSGVCKYMHDNYNLTVFARHIRKENPDQVFTLYLVKRR